MLRTTRKRERKSWLDVKSVETDDGVSLRYGVRSGRICQHLQVLIIRANITPARKSPVVKRRSRQHRGVVKPLDLGGIRVMQVGKASARANHVSRAELVTE